MKTKLAIITSGLLWLSLVGVGWIVSRDVTQSTLLWIYVAWASSMLVIIAFYFINFYGRE